MNKVFTAEAQKVQGSRFRWFDFAYHRVYGSRKAAKGAKTEQTEIP